ARRPRRAAAAHGRPAASRRAEGRGRDRAARNRLPRRRGCAALHRRGSADARREHDQEPAVRSRQGDPPLGADERPARAGALPRNLGDRERASLPPTEVKVLLVTMYSPPAGGGGVQRPLKFATHLPELGIETHVLAPDDPKWIHRDDELQAPTLAWVHRARYF